MYDKEQGVGANNAIILLFLLGFDGMVTFALKVNALQWTMKGATLLL